MLPDQVLIEDGFDLGGNGQVGARCLRVGAFGGHLVTDDVVAKLDALVADEHRRAGDELLHLVLALAAKGAVQDFLAGGAFFVGHGASAWRGYGSMIVEKKRGP